MSTASPRITLLHRYMLREFLSVLLICLFAATSVFLVFDFFERLRVFVREDATFIQVIGYLLFKVPLIIQLMMPVAVLIATMISVGRLSQNSEITAMRACGVSLFWLAKPLLYCGLVIAIVMFIAGETIVPLASQRVEEIYSIDIKKKVATGSYSRTNFWYRDGQKFYNIGLYDSRTATLNGMSMFELGSNFKLRRRVDAEKAQWRGPEIGWTMENIIEVSSAENGAYQSANFAKLPLVIDETPEDFYNMRIRPETMSYRALKKFAQKLKADGTPVTKHLVDMNAKFAFPLVNFIGVLIAFPFALGSARSGSMTKSFIAGICVGFGYHFVHAYTTSLGAAELIPVIPAAWTATVLLGSIGGYLMAGAEHA